MSLRLFADHCVPTEIIQTLANAGHDVLVLRNYLPKNSDDTEVIANAQRLGSILLSLNGDFADIVTYPPSHFNGIIAIQLRNRPEIIPAVMKRLLAYMDRHPDQGDYRGKLILVESHRIRVR